MSDHQGFEHGEQRGRHPKLPAAVLAGCMATFPAFLYLAFIIPYTGGEYYFLSYLAMGLAFFAGSFLCGAFVSYRFAHRVSRARFFFYLFLGIALAWLVSLMVLAALSLTPLCVGQDNGDGNNDLMLCVVQVVLVSLATSPFALLLIGFTALVTSRFFPSKRDGKGA